jgi:hypothetical protein
MPFYFPAWWLPAAIGAGLLAVSWKAYRFFRR